MEDFFMDVRFGARMLRRSLGFTTVAALSLALGIGANTAIFSFVDAVLLKPPPYPHPEEIVSVWEKPPLEERESVSTLNFLDWKKQNTVFTSMAVRAAGSFTLTGGDVPEELRGSRVSAEYFDIFEVKPALGRTFAPDEEQPGKEHVVVLSHRVWENRFGADRSLIGRTISLGNRPYTVIGVLPDIAFGPDNRGIEEIWTPLPFGLRDMRRDYHWMTSWARLKPGVSLAQARAEMKSIAARIERDYPDSNKGWSVTIDRYVDRVVDDNLRRSLVVLLAAVGAVLLIGCANLANLLLARGAWREREIAVRSALGAGRRRLVRQLLSESVLLACLGGSMGVLVGLGLISGLKAWIPPFFLPAEADVRLDTRVLLFTAAMVILTGILFGIVPAFQATRTDLCGLLKEGGRGATSGLARSRIRSILVVTEVALAFVLLSGAVLLIRSFYRLQHVDPGFETTNIITMELPMLPSQYPDGAQVVSYLSQVMEKIQAVPGVRDVATTSALPLQGWQNDTRFLVEGQPVDRVNRPFCFYKTVSPSYFRAIGMRLLKGRGLADTDVKESPPATVINQTLAKKYFKGDEPIGKRILMQLGISGKNELGPEVPWQVVGVVADEKVDALDDTSPGVYVSYKQSPAPWPSLVVRGAMDPSRLVKAIQRAVWELNKNQSLPGITTLEQIKSSSLRWNRLQTALLSLFAGLAMLLAATGIYGVVSYSVAQRMHEMGVRAALGASHWDQLGLVLRGGMLLTAVGLGMGVLGALGLTRVLESLLFGVSPRDPWTLVIVGIILALVALAACYIPARLAARLDPMVALRSE